MKIPILATTALFRPDELTACMEAGCDGYIVKPLALWISRGKLENC